MNYKICYVLPDDTLIPYDGDYMLVVQAIYDSSWLTLKDNEDSTFSITVSSRGTVIGAERSVVINVLDSNMKFLCEFTITQSENVINYNAPTVSLSYPSMSSNGGTIKPTVSYSQETTYSSGSKGNTITNGGSLTYSIGSGAFSINKTNGNVTASKNSGNTYREATVTCSVSMNGKTTNKTYVVTQYSVYVNLTLSIVSKFAAFHFKLWDDENIFFDINVEPDSVVHEINAKVLTDGGLNYEVSNYSDNIRKNGWGWHISTEKSSTPYQGRPYNGNISCDIYGKAVSVDFRCDNGLAEWGGWTWE